MQHMSPDSSNFFLSFQDVHIDHPGMREIFKAMKKHIVGMDYFLHGLLVGLLGGGHVLVEGAPGLAKTKSIRLLSSLLALDTKRIQFTPDMLPADLIGVDMFNPSTHSFETFFGPLFTNILLADEINRATPKVQSALLEAMQERQVTIGGTSYPLSSPYFVLATQNPIEQDGTYPLPEAQLDRFMMKLTVDYPSMDVEKQIINTATAETEKLEPVMTADTLLELQAKVQQINASDTMIDYVAKLVTATRESHKDLAYGSSPRGSLAIMSLAKALAFLEGRKSIEKKDVQRAILPAFRHRIILSVQAQMNSRVDSEVLFEIVKNIL
ncbi:AAA family ATPase [Patescibacteria group bacterium]|nr:AAA family ATPase [Patescibacteria group bacterium]